MYFVRFVNTVLNKAFYIIRNRKEETAWATGYIKKMEAGLGGKFDELTFKKIVNSYAIYNPMMCDAFAELHGRKTTRGERERMLRYFVCSSLFDNFCDRNELTENGLYAISYDSEKYKATTFDERAFLESHLLLKQFVKNKEAYEEATKKLFKAQIESAKQFNENITDIELENITFAKGGYSVLLCSFYLDIDASESEKQCWYRIGSIIQLTNDLFDIYKDLQDGSVTLATRMQNAFAFNQFFLRLVAGIKKEITKLKCSEEQRTSFLISMMGICAFGLIALEQLMELQGDQLLLPEFSKLPRKALIVDMEKKKNLWKWVKLVYKHSK